MTGENPLDIINHEKNPDPSEYYARTRVMDGPVETLRTWFLTESNLKLEPSLDFERHAPAMISIIGFNFKAEAQAFMSDNNATDDLLERIISLIPATSNALNFTLKVDVDASRPPNKKLLSKEGTVSYSRQLSFIAIRRGNDGFSASSEVLNITQQTFFLELMSRTLQSVLDEAKKGWVHSRNFRSKPSDEIVADHCFITATDEQLQQFSRSEGDLTKLTEKRDIKIAMLTYIKASIDEALEKIRLAR